MVQIERRFDPFFRPAFDAVLRDPLARLTTALINLQRPDEGLKIAEERLLAGEEEIVDSIIASFQQQMRALWKPGGFERGGNTKTQGIVRAKFIAHEGLPQAPRHGIYAQPRSYPAWVRFSGPGPYITPDIAEAQMEFAKRLSYNPWHSIAEHRPLATRAAPANACTWRCARCAAS
jgi:hypothetical protein